MTFIPLTPSVGKEKRILVGRPKVNSDLAGTESRFLENPGWEPAQLDWTAATISPYDGARTHSIQGR